VVNSTAAILVQKENIFSSTEHAHLLVKLPTFQEMNQATYSVISLVVTIISSGMINAILPVLLHSLQSFQEEVNTSVTSNVRQIRRFTLMEHVWTNVTRHSSTDDNGKEISAIIRALQAGSFSGTVPV